MPSFETRHQAERVLASLIEEINEDSLQAAFDIPLQTAANEFTYDDAAEINYSFFLQACAKFVQHMNKQALKPSLSLTLEQAQAEAIGLLEKGYSSQNGNGFEASYIDALSPTSGGLGYVLDFFTKHYIAAARDRHIKWVWFRKFASLDFAVKEAIAGVLLEDILPHFPKQAQHITPAHFVSQVPELLASLLSTDSSIRAIFARHRGEER